MAAPLRAAPLRAATLPTPRAAFLPRQHRYWQVARGAATRARYPHYIRCLYPASGNRTPCPLHTRHVARVRRCAPYDYTRHTAHLHLHTRATHRHTHEVSSHGNIHKSSSSIERAHERDGILRREISLLQPSSSNVISALLVSINLAALSSVRRVVGGGGGVEGRKRKEKDA